MYDLAGYCLRRIEVRLGRRVKPTESSASHAWVAFVQAHTLTKQAAAALGLPTQRLQDREKHGGLLYCSSSFFSLILRVESLLDSMLSLDFLLSQTLDSGAGCSPTWALLTSRVLVDKEVSLRWKECLVALSFDCVTQLEITDTDADLSLSSSTFTALFK